MTTVNHSQRQHALLSASGAKRWLACTPSARLEDEIKEDKSEAADRGTLCHEIAELSVRRKLAILDGNDSESKSNQKEINRLKRSANGKKFLDENTLDDISDAVNYVWNVYETMKALRPETVIELETQFDISDVVPEGFCTGDVTIYNDVTLAVLDYKFGMMPVSAVNNPQLRFYAHGALREFNFLECITEVEMHIVQPKANSYTQDNLTVDELNEWLEEQRPKAEMAYKGEGEFVVGEHCHFCKFAGLCRKKYEHHMVNDLPKFARPEKLSGDEISKIMKTSEDFAVWLKSVEKSALSVAMAGTKIPGFKIVDSIGRRSLTDEKGMIEDLKAAGVPRSKYMSSKLVSLSALEKLTDKETVNKRTSTLDPSPTLVPVSDKRPERSLASEFDDDFDAESEY